MNSWRILVLLGALLPGSSAWAVDSYRFLHVTIDTPWFIFVFLFFLVFAPMILSAILHWRMAMRRGEDGEKDGQSAAEEHKDA